MCVSPLTAISLWVENKKGKSDLQYIVVSHFEIRLYKNTTIKLLFIYDKV